MHRDNVFLNRPGFIYTGFIRPGSLLIPIFLFTLIFSIGVANASTQQEAMDWIQKMSRAMQELSYKGRFVYAHNNQLESMSILHVNDAQGKRERLVSLNGEAREILRDNNNLTCIWPSSRQVVVDQSNQSQLSPLWVPDDVRRLGEFYTFRMSGKDRIADYPAVVVSIQPKDQYRYGMKIWIHENHGLLLQSVLFDDKGRKTEQIMFTDLALMHYDDQKSFNVLPQIDSGYALIRYHSGESSQAKADTRWQVKSLPGGFRIESTLRKKMAESLDFTQQLILTDGMASVSIFIEPTSGQSLSGESSMGAINAFGSQLDDFTVTAIGEVPAITVKQIAQAVIYQK